MLQSKDGHALWVSKTVLQWCDPLLGDVEGGFVVRDALGNPTGSSDLLIACPLSHLARRITRQCTALCEETYPDRRRPSQISRSDYEGRVILGFNVYT